MEHVPLLVASPFLLGFAGFAARVVAMGMTCAVLIWFKNRTG
jgi:hypothetical protein